MNQLKMDIKRSIETLTKQGCSQRQIARDLGINRETVARYRRQIREVESSKPAIPPTESAESSVSSATVKEPTPANTLTSKPAISPAGRRSLCLPFAALIESKIESGLSAQRIYQDLVADHQFAGGYDSVKCFVRKFGNDLPLPFRRMECLPGEEAQVDYGQGAWVVQAGKRRRPHMLRVVLSFSRKGYTEVFWQQTTENFIRGLENAFRHFGGVPRKLVIDNLRAAVTKVDWFDPEINFKVLSFCEHYHCIVLPTKPGMPRHKGKVEAGVKYAQSNALAGHVFDSLGSQNIYLADWEQNTADTRIHGTTKEQVRSRFENHEKAALLPLPQGLFPVFSEARRSVHRDGYVEVDKAYYSVPPEYVRSEVWARWDAALVRIFNQRRVQIAVHCRARFGQFSTLDTHIHSHKRTIVERGADYLLDRCRQLGGDVASWSLAMHQNRGPASQRVMQGFLGMTDKFSPKQLNDACREALQHGSWRLSEIKELLARPSLQEVMPFLEEHPVIRPLSEYQKFVSCSLPTEGSDSAPQIVPSTEKEPS
jgi:transposase